MPYLPVLAREFNLRPKDVYALNVDQWEVFRASVDTLRKHQQQEERDNASS